MRVVEISPAILSFGFLLAVLVVAIAVVDLRQLIIPDSLNLTLAAAGLGFQFWIEPALPLDALLFAALVFVVFLGLQQWFVRVRGVQGLGLGDVKMASASAFWISPWNAALYLLVTCVTALLFVFFASLRGAKLEMKMKVPFGPFLGLGLFVTWLLENTGMPTFIPNGGI